MEQTNKNNLTLGLAGEHLVCFDLMMSGYKAFLTSQDCSYDICLEYKNKIKRVQVKSTRSVKAVTQRKYNTSGYIWNVRRAGKGGIRNYKDTDFDILALVALDIRKIAYFIPTDIGYSTIIIREKNCSDGCRRGYFFEDYPITKIIGANK